MRGLPKWTHAANSRQVRDFLPLLSFCLDSPSGNPRLSLHIPSPPASYFPFLPVVIEAGPSSTLSFYLFNSYIKHFTPSRTGPSTDLAHPSRSSYYPDTFQCSPPSTSSLESSLWQSSSLTLGLSSVKTLVNQLLLSAVSLSLPRATTGSNEHCSLTQCIGAMRKWMDVERME